MSNAPLKARLEDGTILYGEYDGSGDVCYRNLYRSRADANAHWRNHPDLPQPVKEIPAEIGIEYGDGLTIVLATVCPETLQIVSGRNAEYWPERPSEAPLPPCKEHGLPNWYFDNGELEED
jgi:hypothetical protein